MTELEKLPQNEEIASALVEYSYYATMAKSMIFNWFSIITSLVFCLVLAYFLGKQTIRKTVILDTILRESLENVEITKKKLRKKMIYWSDFVENLKWFSAFLALIIGIYVILYFLNPDYVEIVQPIVKNVYFVQSLALLVILLVAFMRYASYKSKSIKNNFNEIDQESQSLFEEILNKMGSKLTKSMAEAIMKKLSMKETKGYCKKEICRIQKIIWEKKAKSAQNLLVDLGKFDWCPLCSSEIEFSINETKKPHENGKPAMEDEEKKESKSEEKMIQTEELICMKNCGRRFFVFCKSKGGEYKSKMDEVAILENQVKQMETVYNKENNILK